MNSIAKNACLVGGLGLGAWLIARALRQPFDYRDKSVLITGGSRGFGLVMARKLAARGARVAICARHQEELEQAGDDLVAYGEWPLILPCDVTDPQQVAETVQAVQAHFGCIDVLINNAGIIQVGPVERMTREDFEQAFESNFWGAYNAIEAVLPAMRQRRSGRIMNISSIGGKISVPHLLPYCASKFALVGYSQGLRTELAKDGIIVTTICPGLMRTGSTRHAYVKGQQEAEYAWFSISAGLPILTIGAQRAAEQALRACARGDAEAILGFPAWSAAKINGLCPNLFSTILKATDRVLPSPEKGSFEKQLGRDSESFWSPSLLTTLNDTAAEHNNELTTAECGEE